MKLLKPTEAGQNLYHFIREVIAVARDYNEDVEMEFNGTTVTVYPESCERDIAAKWALVRTINQMR